MEKADIDRLLEGRRLTEEYERDYPTKGWDAVEVFLDKLKELDFNSPGQFLEWNNKMNRIAYNECVIKEGQCDNCTGYEGAPPEPPCLQLFTKDSPLNIFYNERFSCYPSAKTYEDEFQCYIDDRQVWSSEYDKFREILLRLMRLGRGHFDVDKTKYRDGSPCPEGHGVHGVQVKDLPFDIGWGRRGYK